MQISYRWLKEYVDFDFSPQELKEKLTFLGLEVDAVREIGQGLDSILVGEVLSVKPHPQSDTLFLSEVQVGTKTLPVVVGTDNMQVGDKVPVAPPGSILPGGQEIDQVVIRGFPSKGMLCSAHELGLSHEQDEILILPADLETGQSVAEALELKDTILSLDLTPNYGHCLSMVGVAREVAAFLGSQIQYQVPSFPEEGPQTKDLVSVRIQDPACCPRYSARIIRNIHLQPSPFWMKQRLQAAGIRPINNVVDITNYVMMELGQPLHAFDGDKIHEQQIIVRRAKPGETLITLDGEERALVEEDLLIADPRQAVALAGVMGGLNSEVTHDTSCILLEAAHFHPTTVRKTAKRLGLPSEASHRFERGVDIGATCQALDRAAQLLVDLAGGQVSFGMVDAYPEPKREQVISLRLHRVQQVLGIPLTSSQVKDILTSLHLRVEGEDVLLVTIPTFRMDLQEEIDLMEEVARHYGYDKLPEALFQSMGQGRYTHEQKMERRIRSLLEAMGLWEIITYSFVNPKRLQDFDYRGGGGERWLYLKNPLSADLSVMRTSLLPGLVDTFVLNQSRHQKALSLFELGKVFLLSANGKEEHLSVGAICTQREDPWGLDAGSFFYLKGVLESLFSRLPIEGIHFKKGRLPFLHPGRQAKILLENEEVGFLGEMDPDLVEKLEIRQRCACFELDLALFLKRGGGTGTYQPIPRFPGVKRDLALVVQEEITSQEIHHIIQREGGDLLQEIQVFDLYRGSQLGAGKKSLAFTVNFYSQKRTLKDAEVDAIVERILTALKDTLQAEVRM